MSSFPASETLGPIRSARAWDTAMGPNAGPRTPFASKAPPSPVDAMNDESGAPPSQDRAIGLQHDLQSQANNNLNANFPNYLKQRLQGYDLNNNDDIERLGKELGIPRGRVGMSIDTGTNDTGVYGGNGVRSTGEYHTADNPEYAAILKSELRKQYTAQVQGGAASSGQKLPPSPLELAPRAPAGPTAAGPPQGVSPSPSAAGIDPAIMQGYKQTLAGQMPSQAAGIGRRLGMQPYDVEREQSGAVGAQAQAAAIPGQAAAQQQLTQATAGLAQANASKDQAAAGGAMMPDAVKKQLDAMTAKHQTEVAGYQKQIGELKGQLETVKGGKAGQTEMTPAQLATSQNNSDKTNLERVEKINKALSDYYKNNPGKPYDKAIEDKIIAGFAPSSQAGAASTQPAAVPPGGVGSGGGVVAGPPATATGQPQQNPFAPPTPGAKLDPQQHAAQIAQIMQMAGNDPAKATAIARALGWVP